MMLVEMRMRKAGTYGGASARKKPERPASFASEFERVMFEKPAFKAVRGTRALRLLVRARVPSMGMTTPSHVSRYSSTRNGKRRGTPMR